MKDKNRGRNYLEVINSFYYTFNAYLDNGLRYVNIINLGN